MEHQELKELLYGSEFVGGWCLLGTELILWEHDAEPPAPLTRPKPNQEPTEP